MDAVLAPSGVGSEDDLTVTQYILSLNAERANELFPVVDSRVCNQNELSLLEHEGLKFPQGLTGCMAHPVRDPDSLIGPGPRAVRATMRHGNRHGTDGFGRRTAVKGKQPADGAHVDLDPRLMVRLRGGEGDGVQSGIRTSAGSTQRRNHRRAIAIRFACLQLRDARPGD